ncbi:MAG: type I-D CRISPR-associated helicase Cas3' [Halanaerobiales bacterium]|nr:type I-D CRISPR-associated helicase Cas3' [Halanaerobiales bacterium]
MKIDSYSIEQVKHPKYLERNPDWYPYQHQALMLDLWEKQDAIVQTTKTGSGKTQSAAFPMIYYKKSGCFLAPTNALLESLQDSISQMCVTFGWKAYIYRYGEEQDKVKLNHCDVILIQIDGDQLQKDLDEGRFRTKGMALEKALSTGKPKILLTNPDTLFLVMTLRYRNSLHSIGYLREFDTLIIDEFHLYYDLELSHLLFLIHLSRELRLFNKTIFLSATPEKETKELLDSLFQPCYINSESRSEYPIVGERVTIHPITLEVRGKGVDLNDTIVTAIQEKKDLIDKLFEQNSDEDFVPAVIIVNSVIYAIQIQDRLIEKRWLKEEIGIYRGLSDRRIRTFRGKKLIIGTSSLEVGIDFKTQFLFFQAGNLASFLQRFGRLGRHQIGYAILFDDRVEDEFNLLNTYTFTREDFENLVADLYCSVDRRVWFLISQKGLEVIGFILYCFIQVVGNNEEEKRMIQILQKYLDCLEVDVKAKHLINKVRRGIKKDFPSTQWMREYFSFFTFRKSLPSVQVYDSAEEHRNGSGFYTADLKTLLEKGKDLKWTGQRIEVTGYEHKHKVQVSFNLNDQEGKLLAVNQIEDFMLRRDGRPIFIGNYFKENTHICIVVPKFLRTELDWMISTFNFKNRYQEGIIAFDAAALVVWEICQRKKSENIS